MIENSFACGPNGESFDTDGRKKTSLNGLSLFYKI